MRRLFPNLEQKRLNFYNTLNSPIYNLTCRIEMAFSKDQLDFRQILFDRLDIKEGEKVIEIGSGTGFNIPYYPDNAEIYFFDINKHLIKKSRKKAEKHGKENIDYVIGNMKKIGFKKNSFDVAVLTYALSGIPKNNRNFYQVERIVRPGGRIGILDYETTEKALMSGMVDMNLNEILLYNLADSKLFHKKVYGFDDSVNETIEHIYILENKY